MALFLPHSLFSPLFRASDERPPVFAILTSKVGSIDDNGSGGIYAYRSSKAACNQMAKSLSIDLYEQGVKCVLLHPGYVRTDMTRGNGLIDTPESVSGFSKPLRIPARTRHSALSISKPIRIP